MIYNFIGESGMISLKCIKLIDLNIHYHPISYTSTFIRHCSRNSYIYLSHKKTQ